jgi:hypothetical protein
MATAPHIGIRGFVSSGFEAMRVAFLENFSHRRESGATCGVYRKGEKSRRPVGGIRNKATGEPWEEDTMLCGIICRMHTGASL